MKISIVLIALFCVLAINATDVQESSPLKQAIINQIIKIVQYLEMYITVWSPLDSLEKNLSTAFEVIIKGGGFAKWNPDADIRTNFVNLIEALIKKEDPSVVDENMTIRENIERTAISFLRDLPISEWVPTQSIADRFAEDILNAITSLNIPGLDVEKPLYVDVEPLVDDILANVKLDQKAPIEEVIPAVVKSALSLINLDGFDASKTLEENIWQVGDKIFHF